uniref:Secreted protein n=1 Tax=Arundo donax TaxID=35708 RepID=A0A0A9C963_ARUDO
MLTAALACCLVLISACLLCVRRMLAMCSTGCLKEQASFLGRKMPLWAHTRNKGVKKLRPPAPNPALIGS